MLKGTLINPDIIAALALCGHGDNLLIADGNYPLASKTDGAKTVYLALSPGLPTVTQALAAIQSVCALEKAELMEPGDGGTPEIFGEFRKMLGDIPFERTGRGEFYELCREKNVRLAISTGEQRLFANILLTIGTA